jgi:hypothetical protein
MQSILARLTTVLESFQSNLSVTDIAGTGRAMMRPGAVWNPMVSIAGAFGEVPGAIAGVASMAMGQGGVMGGMAQGGTFSNLQFAQWQREMTSQNEARSISMEATLSRIGITGAGATVSRFMPMVNMIDPEIGKAIDSVLSYAAANTHLTASGLAAVDQYARLGGAIPGEAGYASRLGSVSAFATAGGLGKAGRSADIRAAMRLIDRTSSDASLNQNTLLAGSIQELQHGLGMDLGQIVDVARNSGAGALSGLAERSYTYGNLAGLSGGKLGAAVQMLDNMGVGGLQFMRVIAEGGMAHAGGGLEGVSIDRLNNIAMRTAVKVAGGKDVKTAQAMAEVDPVAYRRMQAALASGDTRTAQQMLYSFRSGKDAAMVSSSESQAMARLDPEGAVVRGLARLDLQRDATLLGGKAFADRLASLNETDWANIQRGDLQSVRGYITANTRSLIERYALSRQADKGESTVNRRLVEAHNSIEKSGQGQQDMVDIAGGAFQKILEGFKNGDFKVVISEFGAAAKQVLSYGAVPQPVATPAAP